MICRRVASESGLSPRVRGNHAGQLHQLAVIGSIPACAGEPRSRPGPGLVRGVYPRVCGGTALLKYWAPDLTGLSPRVRGNHVSAKTRNAAAGSIPACAGEPPGRVLRPTVTAVYPRVCGGTRVVSPSTVSAVGLSPRVRGNRDPGQTGPARRGSIPACAGEPSAFNCPTVTIRVYPRVCGGTHWLRWAPSCTAGLSPRVRGNRVPRRPGGVPRRSIPACAGEPRLSSPPNTSSRVYPRVCGGTGAMPALVLVSPGLSPRVRGNRCHARASVG